VVSNPHSNQAVGMLKSESPVFYSVNRVWVESAPSQLSNASGITPIELNDLRTNSVNTWKSLELPRGRCDTSSYAGQCRMRTAFAERQRIERTWGQAPRLFGARGSAN
jgi:hypothetical protein